MVPEFLLPNGVLDFLVSFGGCWHDQGTEVVRLEYEYVSIVLLSLVMVVSAREEVRLLVRHPRLMVEREVVFC